MLPDSVCAVPYILSSTCRVSVSAVPQIPKAVPAPGAGRLHLPATEPVRGGAFEAPGRCAPPTAGVPSRARTQNQ